MQDPLASRLLWRGHETVQSALEVLERRGYVEIELPADYHHTLFVHVHPDARPADVEQVDAAGGAELLEHIARIRGLEVLEALSERVREATGEVRVQSPSPRITISLAGR